MLSKVKLYYDRNNCGNDILYDVFTDMTNN